MSCCCLLNIPRWRPHHEPVKTLGPTSLEPTGHQLHVSPTWQTGVPSGPAAPVPCLPVPPPDPEPSRAAASVVRSSRLAVAGRLPTSHQYAGTGTGTGTGALTRGRGDAREAGPRKSARDGWGEGPTDPASPSPCLFYYSPTHTDRCATSSKLALPPSLPVVLTWVGQPPSPRREHLHLPPAYIHMAAPWPSRAAC